MRWRSSARVPDSTARPRLMMVTRSQSASTSDRMWLESRTVRPRCRSSSIHARNAASMSGSRPAVGSSRSSSSTSEASAATSATFCRLPLEYARALTVGSRSKRCEQAGPAARVQAAAQPPEQVDDLAAGQRRPERDIARDVGEPAVQFGGLAPGIAAEQPRGAAAGPQQAEQNPDRRRLA